MLKIEEKVILSVCRRNRRDDKIKKKIIIADEIE